jgi:hypothetical protein
MSKAVEKEDDKYDEIFTQVAGQIGSVQGLLDKFFGFMHRKTDFYVQFDKSNNEATMGFLVGVAEKMVLNSFNGYKMKEYNLQPKIMTSTSDSISCPKGLSETNEKTHITTEIAIPPAVLSSNIESKQMDMSTIKLNSIGQQIPVCNGGVTSNYYWTQTLSDLTVYINASNNIKGKDIKCNIRPNSLHLVVLGEILINGDLEETVRLDESMWTLNRGDFMYKIGVLIPDGNSRICRQ